MIGDETSATTRLQMPELGACALVQDLLPLYLEGEVSPGSRDLIVEHLARCEKCAGFLAGAQSVRTQIRRDGTQRAAAAERDQPALQVLAQGGWLVLAIGVLTSSAFGAGGSLLTLYGWAERSIPWLLFGGATVAVSFAFLVALARSRGPLVWQRALALVTACAMGAASALPLYLLGNRNTGMALSLLLGMIGLAGVWASVAVDGAPQQAAGSVPWGNRALLGTALLLGGALALLLPLLLGQLLPMAGALGALVLLALLFGPMRG